MGPYEMSALKADSTGRLFEPLRDAELFAQVQVDCESARWSTGADLDPIVVYEGLGLGNLSKPEHGPQPLGLDADVAGADCAPGRFGGGSGPVPKSHG
jgi:hypothetical protein